MIYGLPYKGSKNSIAKWVISNIPKSHTFVDLFAGGCAVTHAAILSGKFDRFIANDITDVPQLFIDAINGKYRNERRWISRDDFFRLKDFDPYVRIVWSFGNDCKTYLYAPEVERFKKHLHGIFFADSPHEARLKWKGFVREFVKVRDEIGELTQKALSLCKGFGIEPIYNADGTLNVKEVYDNCFKVKSSELRTYLMDALKESGKTQKDVESHLGNFMCGHYFGESQWRLPTAENYIKLQEIIPGLTKPYAELSERLQSLQSLQSLESLQSLQSLERLQSLQSLESLESLQRLEVHKGDYRSVKIPEEATVYCDPPYNGTSGYLNDFNHNEFYKWLRSVDFPVYVSEYSMPDDFIKIASISKNCTYSATKNTKREECLFVHERWADRIKRTAEQGKLF